MKRFPNGNCIGAFGGMCEGRVIVGFEKNVFEYLYKEDAWRQVQKDHDVLHDRIGAKCCSIGDGLLVVCPNLNTHAELIRFTKDDKQFNAYAYPASKGVTDVLQSEGTCPTSEKSKTAAIGNPSCNESNGTNTRQDTSKENLCPQTACITKLPVKIKSCVLTSLGNDDVLLIECNSQNKSKVHQCFIGSLVEMIDGIPDSVTWNSSMSPDMIRPSNDWPDVRVVSSMNRRYDYIIFKMGTCVYITGGFSATNRPLVSCVYFDLVLKNWFTYKYILPYHLCESSVVVSKDERYAIIIGGKKDSEGPEERCSDELILFTEDDGFRELRNSSLMRKRSSHVSILLP